MLARDKMAIVCGCSHQKNVNKLGKICEKAGKCYQIEKKQDTEYQYSTNDQKKVILALQELKKAENTYNTDQSTNLSVKNNPQNPEGKYSKFLRPSLNIKRKNSFSQAEDQQKSKVKTHRKSFSVGQNQPNNMQSKPQQTANIINISNGMQEKKLGQPLSARYKSSYCKRITMSNLDKYYQYCVSRLQEKVVNIDEEELKMARQYSHHLARKYERKEAHKNDIEKKLNEIKKINEQMQKSHSQNIKKTKSPCNLLDEEGIPDSLTFQPSRRYSHVRASSDKSQYGFPKTGRYSISQNCNRPRAHSYFQKSAGQSRYNQGQKKNEMDLSPWDAPDPNFDQFQA